MIVLFERVTTLSEHLNYKILPPTPLSPLPMLRAYCYLLCHRYIPLLLNFMDEVHDVEELDHEEKQQHQHHLKQIKHATHHIRPSNLHLVNHVCVVLQVLCVRACGCDITLHCLYYCTSVCSIRVFCYKYMYMLHM